MTVEHYSMKKDRSACDCDRKFAHRNDELFSEIAEVPLESVVEGWHCIAMIRHRNRNGDEVWFERCCRVWGKVRAKLPPEPGHNMKVTL